DDRIARHDKPVLMRMKAKDAAPDELHRAGFDDSDRRVAVFDGRRKLSFLKRAAHSPPLALRHFTAEHEGLGASADRAGEAPDQQLARCRRAQPLRPDFTAAGRRYPER